MLRFLALNTGARRDFVPFRQPPPPPHPLFSLRSQTATSQLAGFRPWILSWLDLAQDPETTSRNQACLQSGRWRTNRGAIKQPSNDRETGEKMQSQDCSFSSWSSRIKVLKCAEQQPNGRFGRAILRIPLSCDTWFFSCCLVYPLLSFHALHQSKSIAGFTATHLKIAVVPALQVAVNAWVLDDVLHSPKAWKATRVDKTPRDLLQ